MTFPVAAVLLSSLALVVGIFITVLLHSRHGMEIVAQPVELRENLPAPLISVVIPARNEERNIRRCVGALLEQTYPNYEVIVVDDRSTDATPQILARLLDSQQESREQVLRLKVVPGIDLPPGWAGKPHALWQGVRHSNGEWLCFIDADTFASRHLLSSAYSTALENRADLFTMLTDQELGSFWEKTVLPLVFLGLSFGFPANRINDPNRPEAIANGQFILIQRTVYENTGGHQTVRGRIDEDKALAELVKGQGYRLVMADGRQLASTRMYTSLPEMWEGWTKNIYLGLRDRLGLLLFGASMGLIGSLALPAWLILGFVWFLSTGRLEAGIVAVQAVGLWGFLLYQRVRAARAFGISELYSLTLPIGALVFTSMMFTSAFKVLSGQGVAWRGRVYKG